jgi:hypothetical protein
VNVIIIILAVIAVASSFSIWVGLVMLFFKSRRKNGARIAVVSLFNIVVLGGVGAALQAKYGTDPDAGLTATQTTDPEAPIIASAETTSTTTAPAQSTNEPAWKVAGFPSFRAAAQAKNVFGVKSFEAYQLRNNAEAIGQWCEMKAAQRTLSHQRDAELDTSSDEEGRKEITGRYDALQRELTKSLASQLGIKEWELKKLTMNAPWPTYCRAKSKGWAVVTPELAAATTQSDAKEALAALRGYYDMNLKGNSSPYFDNSRYAAVTCRRKAVDDLHLVGCILQSFSNPSSWDVFVVGRLQNGQLAVAPIDGLASSHITSVGDLKSFQAPNAPKARLAEFAGQINQSAVDELFD